MRREIGSADATKLACESTPLGCEPHELPTMQEPAHVGPHTVAM
jgi:hypothetical protein